MRRWIVGGVAVVACGLATPAVAAVGAQNVAKKLGMRQNPTAGLDVRLGLGSFTGSLGEDVGVGPLLGITADVNPWKYVGIEAGWELQRLPISTSRVDDEGEGLWRNNLGFTVKAGPTLNERWRPYAGVGFGVSYINPTSGADDVYRNDWITETPFSLGVDYRLGEVLFAGARATYRLVGGEDIVNRPGTDEEARGGLFNANLTLGGRF
ncbi:MULTISPECIES: outer membrane beta-barrel protein [Myxococcus]|uniref:outer membrane beta-barrel protein n=1 Tax=Myxococcus TaxID=32 RepID=UPI001595D8BE|nr:MULTISPECIES: outer membrane beta-barrel protein [Myxococcus]NVJ28642.1 outer membrane beta-barrel protein [Myxococcus sp. AM011]